jgi:hypothetical protein
MNGSKPASRIYFFITSSLVLFGLLAGETIDRIVIGERAWQYAGINAWANYSRHADLGNGIFVYPFEAITGVIFLIAASVILRKNKPAPPGVSLIIYVSTFFAVTGLLLTFWAGPFMLSIRKTNDPVQLQFAFDQFYYWSAFRGLAHLLTFLCLCWLSGKIMRDYFRRTN